MKLFKQSASLGATARTCLAACLCSTLSLALAGCGQVNGSSTASYAQLRVVDTSPTAGALDMYLGTTALTYNIGFGSVVAYTPVAPGSYTISAHMAGGKSVVTSGSGSLVAGTQYTVLIGDTASGINTQVLTDQSQPAPGSQSIVRIIDQASQIGSVDIYLIPQGGSLLTTRAVATAVKFNDVRSSLSVPSNTYQIALLPAGTVPVAATTTAAATVPIYTGAATSLPAGSARTVVLLDTQVTTTPVVNAVVLSDYDSPYATS